MADIVLVAAGFVRAVWRGVNRDDIVVEGGSLEEIAQGAPALPGDRWVDGTVVPLEDVALVKSGVVTQVWRRTPIETLVPGAYDGTLYPVAAETRVSPGMRHVNGEVLPPLPNLAAARESALADLVSWLDAATVTLTGMVPRAELDSWPNKEASARAFVANAATTQQIEDLEAEALQTGETVAALAARIVARANAWRPISMGIAGVRRKAAADLAVADSLEAIRAVVAAARSSASALIEG